MMFPHVKMLWPVVTAVPSTCKSIFSAQMTEQKWSSYCVTTSPPVKKCAVTLAALLEDGSRWIFSAALCSGSFRNHVRACPQTHTHTHTYTLIHTQLKHTDARAHNTLVRSDIHTCTHSSIGILIHTHTHTYTQTQTLSQTLIHIYTHTLRHPHTSTLYVHD